MLVRKSFQFRLRPTKKQAKELQNQLEECRWLYNALLEQRKLAYEELDISLSKYQQRMLLPLMKEERDSLCQVHSQVLQNVVNRLDKAFQAFFRRCKKGEKPGFPRFRGVHRYNSLCYPQSGFFLTGNELTRISHQPFGSPEHLFHHLLPSEVYLGKVHEPSLRIPLRHLVKQSVQFCTSVGEKYGLRLSKVGKLRLTMHRSIEGASN